MKTVEYPAPFHSDSVPSTRTDPHSGQRTTVGAVAAVFVRDWQCEWRTRAALNAALLFAVSAPIALSFSVVNQKLSPELLGGCFWTVLLFAALVGLSRVFIKEVENETFTLLRLNAPSDAVLWGKMGFNLVLLVLTQACAVPIFVLLLSAPIHDARVLLATLVLGDVGLAAIGTLLAAIAAQTRSRGTLFSAIAIPVVLPLILAASVATGAAFGSGASALAPLQVLFAYAIAMLAAAWMLFDFVWT